MNVFDIINSNQIKNMCSICLDNNIENEKVYQCNQCNYQFHSYCLEKWIEYKRSCPNCRFTCDFDYINIILFYNQYQYYVINQNIYTIIICIKNFILFTTYLFTICFIIIVCWSLFLLYLYLNQMEIKVNYTGLM